MVIFAVKRNRVYRETLRNDYRYEGFIRALRSCDQKVIGSVVNCQNLTRKVLVCHWLLQLLIGLIRCIFPQFQWVTYDVYHLIYHPNFFIA